jgi:hypothetical protein
MSDMKIDRNPLEPEEERALAELLDEPHLAAAEWDRLHGRIARAAAPALARRRMPRRARGTLPRWLVPVLPLAAAALLVLLLRTPGVDPAGTGPAAVELGPAERALLADVSDVEFAQLVSGAADAEALLLMAVSEERSP